MGLRCFLTWVISPGFDATRKPQGGGEKTVRSRFEELVQEGVSNRPRGRWKSVWGIRIVCFQVVGLPIQLIDWPGRADAVLDPGALIVA